MPPVVRRLAGPVEVEPVWRNAFGGLTFRFGDRFVKWNPPDSPVDLERERLRLEWISARHPAPSPLEWGVDGGGQWLLTAAVGGQQAVGDRWRSRRREAIGAMATGLRAIHSLAVEDLPPEWTRDSWVAFEPPSLGPRPPVGQRVVVHGDACAPNTLISEAGEWTGNVDFGDLSVGDRWADLAVASLSVDWNFGPGHQHEFYEAYGVEPDPVRIAYYRALWNLES